MLLLSAVVGEGSVLRGSVVEGKFRGRGKLRSRGRFVVRGALLGSRRAF